MLLPRPGIWITPFYLTLLIWKITTLQKVARENGISSGLLNVVGHAARQSPDDHGASVIRQLHLLMHDEADDSAASIQSVSAKPVTDEFAANDAASSDFERLTSLQKIGALTQENWRPLLVDGAICLVLSFLAINLVR